jgi:hypothetical protein
MTELLVSEEAFKKHGNCIINFGGQDDYWRG